MVSETFLRASQCKEANIEHQSSFITILLNKESPLLIIVIFLSSASGHNISLGQEAGGLSGFAVGINQSIRSARLQNLQSFPCKSTANIIAYVIVVMHHFLQSMSGR